MAHERTFSDIKTEVYDYIDNGNIKDAIQKIAESDVLLVDWTTDMLLDYSEEKVARILSSMETVGFIKIDKNYLKGLLNGS